MAMTPRGLRRLDEGARITEEREHRELVGRLRRDLATAKLELERAIGPLTAPGPHPMSDAEVNGAAARAGAAASRLAEVALELAVATEARRGRR